MSPAPRSDIDAGDPDRAEDETHREYDQEQLDHRSILPQRRRGPKLWLVFLAGALTASLVMASIVVTLPLIAIQPGPTREAGPLVTIPTAPTFTSEGTFLVTTVTIYETTLWGAVRGWLDGHVSVVPRSSIYPPGASRDQIDQETTTQMDESQYFATVAALRELGYQLPEEGALIRQTVAGTPATKDLVAGDAIVAIDGVLTQTPEQLTKNLETRKPGDAISVRIDRDGETRDFPLTLAGKPDDKSKAFMGVELIQNYRLPFEVFIDAGEIGGPSAGLTFAMTIFDLLHPYDLTRGRKVADTGTINALGEVGPVGGIAQKVAAAERAGAAVFLVPQGQLSEALSARESTMRIIGVSTLKQAVEALRSLN